MVYIALCELRIDFIDGVYCVSRGFPMPSSSLALGGLGGPSGWLSEAKPGKKRCPCVSSTRAGSGARKLAACCPTTTSDYPPFLPGVPVPSRFCEDDGGSRRGPASRVRADFSPPA
eukprot:6630852-Prymnesium_polylepis.1